MSRIDFLLEEGGGFLLQETGGHRIELEEIYFAKDDEDSNSIFWENRFNFAKHYLGEKR